MSTCSSSVRAPTGTPPGPTRGRAASSPPWSGVRWRSGGSTCRPAWSCARLRTGTSMPAVSTRSRRTSRTTGCVPSTTTRSRSGSSSNAAVSWAFADPYVDQTRAHRGWWRRLSAERRAAIAAEFWQVGRLTLEPSLVPRLAPRVVTSHPGCSVTAVTAVTAVTDGGDVVLTLSDGTTLAVDHVVLASDYQADLAAVPYPAGSRPDIGHRGLPRPEPGLRDHAPGSARRRLRLDARLRPLLRVHQGLPLGGTDRRRRDARVLNGPPQDRPTMDPSSSRSIREAAGVAGRPGIVITSPQTSTTKPAPADSRTSRTCRS